MSAAGTKFTWREFDLECLDEEYNTTALNERAVEIPIANAWHYEHELMDPAYLEVGNVLSHYGWGGHRIVDLYEEAEGVTNIDLFEEQGGYDRIVSISTLEHVRCENGPAPYGTQDAIDHLLDLLLPGGKMLVTLPFGQNPYMDVALIEGIIHAHEASTIIWDQENQVWFEEKGAQWRPARENSWANAVWIGTWSI